jgi:hypothetical protein
MDTMMHKTWKNDWAIEEELAGVVEVFYEDEKFGYERTPAEFSNENAGGYQNSISIEGTGLITRGTAVHLAAYHLRRNELIRNKNKFRVSKEGFRYKLGDVIRLQCRMANWGKSFRVMSSTADTITVDRDASTEASTGDVLHIRSYDTVLQQVVTDTYEIDSVSGNVITVTENWDVTPIKGNIVATGSATDIKLRRIVKLTPTVDNYFDVEVETYDADLFDTDAINPDNPYTNYIWPAPSDNLNRTVTRQEIEDLLGQYVPPTLDINIPLPANLTWTGNSVDTVTWSKTDPVYDITFTYAGTTYSITADSTTDQFIYWNPSSPTVFLTTNNISTAAALGNWVMCINVAGVVVTPTPHQLIHGGLVQIGTLTAAHITVANLAAISAALGTITSGEITLSLGGDTRLRIDSNGIYISNNAGGAWTEVIKNDSGTVRMFADILKAGEIVTDKIADDATAINESIYTAAQTTVTTSETTVQSDTITSQGNLIEISCTIDAEADAGDVWFSVRLYHGSTELESEGFAVANGYTKSIVFTSLRYTGSGSQTFYVKAQVTSGAPSFKAGARGLMLREPLGK